MLYRDMKHLVILSLLLTRDAHACVVNALKCLRKIDVLYRFTETFRPVVCIRADLGLCAILYGYLSHHIVRKAFACCKTKNIQVASANLVDAHSANWRRHWISLHQRDVKVVLLKVERIFLEPIKHFQHCRRVLLWLGHKRDAESDEVEKHQELRQYRAYAS